MSLSKAILLASSGDDKLEKLFTPLEYSLRLYIDLLNQKPNPTYLFSSQIFRGKSLMVSKDGLKNKIFWYFKKLQKALKEAF